METIFDDLLLQVSKKTIFEMNDNVFDQIVNRAYGKTDFSLVANEELSNDISKKYTILKKKLSEYDQKDLAQFIDSDKSWVSYILIQDLCNKGILEEGVYIINVSW